MNRLPCRARPVVLAAARPLMSALLLMPALLSAGQPLRLDLNTAERLAVTHGFETRIRRNAARIAELNRLIARSSFLPSIGLYAQASDQSPQPGVRRELLPGAELDLTSPSQMHGYGVQLHYILFAGGRRFDAYEAAKAGKAASAYLLQDAMGTARFQARQLYFQALLLRAQQKLARENAERVAARLAEYEKKFAAGAVSKLELLRVRADAADARLVVSESADRTSASLDLLRLVLGLEAEAPLELVQKLPAEEMLGVDLVRLRRTPVESPRLRAARIAADQARLRVSAEKSAHYPTVSLDARYGRLRPYLGQSRTGNAFYVGVAMVMPLFEGGRTQSTIEKAELQARNAKIRADDLGRRVDNRARIILNRIESLQKNLAARRVSIERAIAVREATEVAAANGAATSRELAEADLALLKNRLDYLRSVVALVTELADWERTTGHSSGIFARLHTATHPGAKP